MNLCKVVKCSPCLVVRRISTDVHKCTTAKAKTRWGGVVSDAEKVVGYPTSFLSLRWILNDEIANVASHIRKLIGTNHPLLKIARNLLLRNELPTWGLIVLLISKAGGLNSKFSEQECDRTADLLHSQRILAEVTEMIKTSHLLHKGLINIEPDTENASDLNFGNNLALLCGDYLLSTSFRELANIRHFEVQEQIATTLANLAESEFVGLRDKQNQPLPSRPLPTQSRVAIPLQLDVTPYKLENILGNMKSEWTLRNVLAGGSLLAKSCQCTLILANHDVSTQELGYVFGRNLALAWQACLEKSLMKEERFSLVSAPVMFHLEYDPGFYREIEKGLSDVDEVDYDLVRATVMAGPGLERTQEMQEEFVGEALDALDRFPDSESRTVLVNIAKSL